MFFKVGLFTFGGGLAMVSVISREVVDERKWLTEKEMGDIVIIAESTPGAIAVNTATYVGYKRAGVFGSIMATLGAVLPSLVIISVIYVFFDMFKENRYFAAAFRGIRSAVIVLLLGAFVKLIRPMPKNAVTLTVAAAVFLVTLFFDFNSIYLILAGGVIGALWFGLSALRAKKRLPQKEEGRESAGEKEAREAETREQEEREAEEDDK